MFTNRFFARIIIDIVSKFAYNEDDKIEKSKTRKNAEMSYRREQYDKEQAKKERTEQTASGKVADYAIWWRQAIRFVDLIQR